MNRGKWRIRKLSTIWWLEWGPFGGSYCCGYETWEDAVKHMNYLEGLGWKGI